jgi:hypothetical protein
MFPRALPRRKPPRHPWHENKEGRGRSRRLHIGAHGKQALHVRYEVLGQLWNRLECSARFSCLDRGVLSFRQRLHVLHGVLTPAAHANEQGKVSKRVEISATMLQNRQVFPSEKERYSNPCARGPPALRITSSLDARGHYG